MTRSLELRRADDSDLRVADQAVPTGRPAATEATVCTCMTAPAPVIAAILACTAASADGRASAARPAVDTDTGK